MVRDVVIVGAGPAGISAAIYLQRLGHNPLVIERDRIGGLLLNANLVENYPGFPDGIGGQELVNLFEEHLEKWGVEVESSEVRKVSHTQRRFIVTTSKGEVEAQVVLVATGTKPKKAGIEGENGLSGSRLYYDVKDIPDVDGKDIIIVGSGDAAFDYALNLSSRAKSVRIVCRSSKPKCISLLFDRVRETPVITLHMNTESSSLLEVDGKLRLSCETSSGKEEFDADYVLIACGRESRWLGIEGLEAVSSIGGMSTTTVPGLFVAGDVKQGDHRQVGIAVGDGVQAAMSIAEYLERGEEK